MNRAQTLNRLGGKTDYIKERLSSAFKAMRRAGLLALQHTPCCNSCSCADLAQKLEDRAWRYKFYDGCVYYHNQDADSIRRMFEEYKYLKRHGKYPDAERARAAWRSTTLMIRYWDTKASNPAAERDSAAVAKLVRACLKNAGIESDWDGDPDRCIEIPLLQDHMKRPRMRGPTVTVGTT